ncbi:hypothetical protein D9M71_584570 [compost metagenome]
MTGGECARSLGNSQPGPAAGRAAGRADGPGAGQLLHLAATERPAHPAAAARQDDRRTTGAPGRTGHGPARACATGANCRTNPGAGRCARSGVSGPGPHAPGPRWPKHAQPAAQRRYRHPTPAAQWQRRHPLPDARVRPPPRPGHRRRAGRSRAPAGLGRDRAVARRHAAARLPQPVHQPVADPRLPGTQRPVGAAHEPHHQRPHRTHQARGQSAQGRPPRRTPADHGQP